MFKVRQRLLGSRKDVSIPSFKPLSEEYKLINSLSCQINGRVFRGLALIRYEEYLLHPGKTEKMASGKVAIYRQDVWPRRGGGSEFCKETCFDQRSILFVDFAVLLCFESRPSNRLGDNHNSKHCLKVNFGCSKKCVTTARVPTVASWVMAYDV